MAPCQHLAGEERQGMLLQNRIRHAEAQDAKPNRVSADQEPRMRRGIFLRGPLHTRSAILFFTQGYPGDEPRYHKGRPKHGVRAVDSKSR